MKIKTTEIEEAFARMKELQAYLDKARESGADPAQIVAELVSVSMMLCFDEFGVTEQAQDNFQAMTSACWKTASKAWKQMEGEHNGAR